MKTTKLQDFPGLGVDTTSLGAVMLPILPIDLYAGGLENVLDPEDLYKSKDPKKFWIKGDVSNKPHVTLKYGLLTPAYEQKAKIVELFQFWTRPSFLNVVGLELFDSPYVDEKYKCLVARVDDDALTEAFNRLSYLPHIDTHPGFKPHVTLAYIKEEHAGYWLDNLQQLIGEVYVDLHAPLDLGKSH